MRDQKPRSKLVLNEATDKSTRFVNEVGFSSRVDETNILETHVVIPDDDGVEDPLSYKQAMNDVNNNQWVKDMDHEMESMFFN
ncbi:gag/pol protein [Cucumis melo var. makuwa]|uniref:Gag/pol protein n=1 Tax=Cucumis melo var. makuwa TaxID=1194695 RepID=A0A5D3DDD0_CUCMM|nr:gag/pol protein [Cucumis melo var. makuwa]TYK21450.1 gag/pol protein [Cucumis melo var. makuwa]